MTMNLKYDLALKVRSVYDRQELNELLKQLMSEDFLIRRFASDLELGEIGAGVDVGCWDDWEARRVYWSVSVAGESWYRA